MRDPKRIHEIVKLFECFWHSVPDWRFGQLLSNLSGILFEKNGNRDPFFLEDDKAKELLCQLLQDMSGKEE